MACRGKLLVELQQNATLQAATAWRKPQAARVHALSCMSLALFSTPAGLKRLSNTETMTGRSCSEEAHLFCCALQETLGLPLDKLEVVPVAEAIKPLPVPALPPYNGYGSLEDSEQSCKNLVGRGLDLRLRGFSQMAACWLLLCTRLPHCLGAVGRADPPCCLIAWVCPATMCHTPVTCLPYGRQTAVVICWPKASFGGSCASHSAQPPVREDAQLGG